MARPKELALDTNLLLDLAEGKDWAHEFRESFLAADYILLAPGAVMEEIAWFDMNGTQRESDLAANVLEQFHEWQLDFFEPSPVADAAARRFALNLIQRRLMPVREKTDGRILGQTAWAQIPVLVTSDRHLLGMDAGSLRLEFERVRLFPVTPAHPKRLLWALH